MEKTVGLSESYEENKRLIKGLLRSDDSFDIIVRELSVKGKGVTFFYIDGFVKDGEMQRVMQHVLSLKELGTARELELNLPYVEVERDSSSERLLNAVLSGQSAILGESFGSEYILVDARTYPARSTQEPESDRVMQGARDGFVETLVMNTALIRRRIRDPRLTVEHISLGGVSNTDVAICYMRGLADSRLVLDVRKKIKEAKPMGAPLGAQSLVESLIKRGWLNPFPKIRTTERPDTAAAQIIEGSVIVITDTSPQALIFPTSIFDYLQQTDDYYFPPLTGTYLRIVRTLILLLSVVITPLWYLYLEYSDILPSALLFLVPDEPGALPIILQLILVEIAIDGLKIASMNTPDMLSNSLSIIGALILGDFAVEIGWVSGDVILYMAFVALAGFAQQNAELGYAFKFVRVITLLLTYFLGIWGFVLGLVIFTVLVATNRTATGKMHYLYPLVPFNPTAMRRLLFRTKKRDFFDDNKNTERK